MAIKVITGYNDPEFKEWEDVFYNNFSPDDWDYMIIGTEQWEVEHIANKLSVCDAEIGLYGDKYWVAVTYHS